MVKFLLHFLFLVAAVALVARRGEKYFWWTLGVVLRRHRRQRRLRRPPARRRADDRRQPRRHGAVADHGRREPDQHLRRRRRRRASTGRTRSPATRTTSGSSCSCRCSSCSRSTSGSSAGTGSASPLMVTADVPARDRARDALAQRPARALLRPARARRPVPRTSSCERGSSLPLGAVLADPAASLVARAAQLLRDRDQVARRHERQRDVDPLLGLRLHPAGPLAAPALRPRAEQLLGLLRVRHRAATNFGPHSFYVALFVESGLVGALLFAAFLGTSSAGSRCDAVDRPRPAGAGDPLAARVRPMEWGLTAALVVDDGLELLLPDDELLLLLRPRDARDRGAGGVRAPASPVVKVCVLTTSYPRHPGDVAGSFVRDAVEELRARRRRRDGRLARVVPALRHRLRRRDREQPARRARGGCCCCRCSCSRSRARRGGRARDADVVHAHWLPSGRRRARDAQAARAPGLGHRTSSSRKRAAVALPAAAAPRAHRRLRLDGARRRQPGARRARRARDPERRRSAGRASARPRSRRTSSTSAGSPRRRAFASSREAAAGFRSSSSATGRCGSSCRRPSGSSRTTSSAPTTSAPPSSACPSRREGYGVAAREAMAYGKAIVATGVGGPRRCDRRRRHGPRRAAGRRRRRCARRSSGSSATPACGAGSATAAREKAQATYAWPVATEATIAVYRDAIGQASGACSARACAAP